METDKRNKKPVVSVIVPIRRGEDISELLSALRWSRYKNFETIIVDEGLERSIQRNIGIEQAKGEYILILDSDQLVSGNLIGECVKMMDKYDALYIPEQILGTDWFSLLRNWERQFYNATPVDVVRFVKKSICPMFDESMSGPEDSDWDRRVRGKRGITINIFYHNDKVTPVKFFRKKAYYAKSMRNFQVHNPGDKILSFWWRCFGVYLENGKWKRFLSKPHYAFGVTFINFVRGIIYLVNR